MSRSAVHTLIGLCLFTLGLVALYAASSPGRAETIPAPIEAPVVTIGPVAPIDGVGPAVERVLAEAGRAGPPTPEESAQIPDHVMAVLVENGVALVVPTGGEG